MSKVITISEYFMGRDVLYPKDLTSTIKENANLTVIATNKLLKFMEDDDIDTNNTKCNSGWRPPSINSKTPGSDPNSPHVTAESIDLSDANGNLKAWVGKNRDKVREAGFIAVEDFKITKTWLHLQTRDKLSWQKGSALWRCEKDGWVNAHTKIVIETMI